MFLGQIFAKNAKNDSKTTFWQRQNRSKNKIRKIDGQVPKLTVKSACFWHVLCYISVIFEDIDLKLCTQYSRLQCPSNICYGFLKILIWGETDTKRKKIGPFFDPFSEIFKILKIRDSSFVALLMSTSFPISQLIVALKLHQLAAIPVNPFCWSKSAKHDVTLTGALTADLFMTWVIIFWHSGVELKLARRGHGKFQSEYVPVLQELFAKNHRGGPFRYGPPPAGRRHYTQLLVENWLEFASLWKTCFIFYIYLWKMRLA